MHWIHKINIGERSGKEVRSGKGNSCSNERRIGNWEGKMAKENNEMKEKVEAEKATIA